MDGIHVMGKDRCFWLQCNQPSGSFSMPSMAQQQAALLQVADGISGLNDINIDVDIEASQVESIPAQSSVSRYYAYSGKKGRHVLGMLSRTGSSAGISSLHPNA